MTAKTKQEELRNKLDNVNSGHHECDSEGYGCKYEEFKGNWSGAMGTYMRCRLKREYEDEIVELINSEVLSVLEELESNALVFTNIPQNTAIPPSAIQSIKNRYKL